jgi:hypothetical protein
MRYVILRDDDTHALTPVSCLERLYRPFLDRNLPVNLATIPEVNTAARMPNGQPEGFLLDGKTREGVAPMGGNPELVSYLKKNPHYHIVQHGCHHEPMEFDLPNRAEAARRLDYGKKVLMDAGFSPPRAFVAPHDKFSPASFQEVAGRFNVVSSGWYEWRRLPPSWWPRYAVKRLSAASHWRMGRTVLLSHPGCLLSYNRPPGSIMEEIIDHVESHRLTVLVTHWWEYFHGGKENEPFIGVLHELAAYLGRHHEIQVISFDDLADGKIPMN